MSKKNKAQEEMVGFAIIIIIVAVIILVFLGFYLKGNQKQEVKSYEVESFIQAVLQYTSECKDNFDYLSVKELIFACSDNEICSDGQETCSILSSTLAGISNEAWKTQGDRPIKAYELKVLSNNEEIISLSQGNQTRNYKGSVQGFSRPGQDVEIVFNVYY